MRVLLDTNVISEIRHPNGNEFVKHRIAAVHADVLFVSAVVFAELTKGVLRLPKGQTKGIAPLAKAVRIGFRRSHPRV